jgi:hypothetical protein
MDVALISYKDESLAMEILAHFQVVEPALTRRTREGSTLSRLTSAPVLAIPMGRALTTERRCRRRTLLQVSGWIPRRDSTFSASDPG